MARHEVVCPLNASVGDVQISGVSRHAHDEHLGMVTAIKYRDAAVGENEDNTDICGVFPGRRALNGFSDRFPDHLDIGDRFMLVLYIEVPQALGFRETADVFRDR